MVLLEILYFIVRIIATILKILDFLKNIQRATALGQRNSRFL